LTFSQFIAALISPLGAAVLLGILALAALLRDYERLGLWIGSIAIAWLWIWSTPAASLALSTYVESQYPVVPISSLPSAAAIVVLGGSVRPPETPDAPVDLGGGADRVWHAARLYKAGKAPLIVLCGGSDPGFSVMSEAQAMQVFLRDLGVPDQAVLLEEESRNTRQNAQYAARLLHERGLRRVLLVTSALHMERARLEFESEGLEVIAAPTDRQAGAPPRIPWRYLPDTDSLSASARALKELVGQWVVRMSPGHRLVRPD